MAGLLIWLPLAATFLVIRFIFELLDRTLGLLPQAYQPSYLLGYHIPGFGVLMSIVILLVTGILVTNFIGAALVNIGERFLDKIPLVRSIYQAVKQVLATLFSSNSNAFRKVLLVEYPRKGLWSIAFQTGVTCEKIHRHTEEDLITIFVPTTPNPTSGFLMMVSRQEAIVLDMSVDEALKMVISLGVMQPDAAKKLAKKSS